MSTRESKTKKVVDVRSIPARRLYRGVLEYARRLENGRQHRRNLMSIFQSEHTGLRIKLRDACEKLMFTHPLEYGRKAEELIWRKVYYEVIQLVKSNKKFLKTGTRLELFYKEYLSAAVGYYHHLLLKLQSKYQPKVDVDWPFTSNPLSGKSNSKPKIMLPSSNTEIETAIKEKGKPDQKKAKKKVILRGKSEEKDTDIEEKPTVEQWAQDTCYRILLCLGDLGRYLVEHGGSRAFSERFYQLALLVKPNIGMPFNQLGTLAGHHTWWGLTAAYYYYRCLEAENRFDGAEGNLQKLLDRNKKSFYQIPTNALENMISTEEYKREHTRIFIVSFLYLCDLLRPKTYATDVEITGLCKKLVDALPVCLSNSFLPKDEIAAPNRSTLNGNASTRMSKWNSNYHHHHHHYHSSGDYTTVQPHVILKMCILCIINIHSLQSSRSNRSSAAIAFALAFFSHLLGHVISKLDQEMTEGGDDSSAQLLEEGLSDGKDDEQNVDENGDGDASHAQSKNRSQSKKKKKSRMLRRRRHRGSGDSDLSEGELYSGSNVSDYDSGSDSSDSNMASSSNSELSQERMDDPLKKQDSSPQQGKTLENKTEVQESRESRKNEDIVDNHAGLELANSLANGQSTLASLKDISQKMFQPTVRRKILLAPSFFNNISKPKARLQVSNSPNMENENLERSELHETEGKAKQSHEKGDTRDEDAMTDDVNEMVKDNARDQKSTPSMSMQSRSGGHCDTDDPTIPSVFAQVEVVQQLFASLKLLCDWLDANEQVTAACAQNSKALWSRIAKLASLVPNEDEMQNMVQISSDEMLRSQLNIAKSSSSSTKKWQQVAKLPEDYILNPTTSSVRYKNESDNKLQSLVCDLTETQQSVIRICRIRSFCHSLTRVEGLEMRYDEATKKFEGPEEPQEEDTEHLDIQAMEEMRKTRLMKDMAELRLRNEVNALESQLGTPRTRDASLCLYLVPDALALCHDLIHVKRLLSSEKFFIVIPKTVIDGLDGLKKDLQGARDAIRYLETEFKKGNRYIKAQIPDEASRGVVGERPKLRRNDMQAWRFYRIIECCRYITQEKVKDDNHSSSGQNDTSGLVAILTHSIDKSTLSQNQINAISAAESFGIQVFSTVQFSKLWKKPRSEE